MAPIGTLWGVPRQFQTKIIRSVAVLNDQELVQPEFDFAAKPAEYTAKFPYGKIPAFEGSDGFTLIEGIPIARYLCGLGTKVNLLGSNKKEIALVDQWVHFAEQEIGVPAYTFMGMVYGLITPFDREALNKLGERLARSLTHVEAYLGTRPSGYLVSDSVTLADYVLAGMVYGCAWAALGAAERAKYPLIFAHYAKVTEVEKVKEFWGTAHFTEVAANEPRSFPSS